MRIILTHEQADFDALASMLGAYLLDEEAIPVLPWRMNRNVRAFITLYGAELPFVEAPDLPVEAVEAVCLVDAQSITTVKGMSAETRVHIIDHHTPRSDLPEAWSLVSAEVGATATMLVEQLRESAEALEVIHATLLLLGIYEDTGSLTYTRTTARDLEAAAYLLEQGASLRIAADFLNHPLSTQQQLIYDHLRATAEGIEVNGYTVIVACGDALELDEELSTIAHKLRDVLDPDALILLITTRSGVQLICRSTVDNIDVAEIAAHFGGGGHARAAAGLVRGGKRDEIYTELVRILPKHVRPAVTVAQIMSPNPHVLTPRTTVQEAAEQMQRYGYEGYPVVHEGRVVGLLTRRAVDRSLAHKMGGKEAVSVMEAGTVTIHPGDSIEHLQRLMTETGWGQVPVVHPESGAIIGIVTRTDLLKTLTAPKGKPGPARLIEKLEKTLPPSGLALLKCLAHEAHEHHLPLYSVGGFVRDLLLDRASMDFDLVVEGDAILLGRAMQRRFGGRLIAHERFGTAKWIIRELHNRLGKDLGIPDGADGYPDFVDLSTARIEYYSQPTALPMVERGSLKLDLHRRDFTINTLAVRLDGPHFGELHDYWGGLNDLRNRQVRVLHSLSFVDDPTRMLRAVRFEQRFGFQIEARTLDLLHEALPLFGRVSGDRIRHELDHILDEADFIAMFERLAELGLLAAIHYELKWDEWTRERFQKLGEFSGGGLPPGGLPPSGLALCVGSESLTVKDLAYNILLLRLPAKIAGEVTRRLKYPASRAGVILAACRLWSHLDELVDLPTSGIVSRLEDKPLQAIYACYLASQDMRLKELLLAYLEKWRNVTPSINGHDLRERGIPPGPAYSRILNELRRAWLDSQITTIEEEQALLNRLIADEQN